MFYGTEYDYSQFDFEVRYRMLFCSPTVLCSVTVFDPMLIHPGCV